MPTGRHSGPMAIGAAVALLMAVGAVPPAGGSLLEPLRLRSRAAEQMLRRGVTEDQVQAVQQEVLDGLDELIASLETEGGAASSMPARPGEAAPSQTGGSTSPPRQPAEESAPSAGRWAPGRLREAEPVDETWLPQLPPAERQKVADTFATGRLPARYRDLLRQYSRRLAEEGRE
ncbi:MAG: hypothetical protein AMK73_10010 [Planctomycetes bacterium SM23_32]|nr:MAG: hypothetical protein AMK73_10010 [Planctomycetes bacterium SM23_32]